MAQVVERYFREVEAASSSLVTPILRKLLKTLLNGISRAFLYYSPGPHFSSYIEIYRLLSGGHGAAGIL